MGACCAAVRIEAEEAAERAYTDLQLLTRRQTFALPQDQCEALLAEAAENAFVKYFQCAEKVLEIAPLTEDCLQTRLTKETKYVLSSFKFAFREGSSGTNVAFDLIKAAEQQLNKRLGEVTAAVQFLNRQRSYEYCTDVAAELLKQYQAKQKSLLKVITTYKSQATGSFATLCGKHLEELIVMLDQEGETGMLALRQHQLREELKLVNAYRTDALERCSSANFHSLGWCSRHGSTDSRKGLSFIEFIERIPSVESRSCVSNTFEDTQKAEMVLNEEPDSQGKTLY